MKNIIITAAAFLFFFTTATFAQPVQKPRYMVNGKCTPEGALAYHKAWGISMGYTSPAETATEIEKIYRDGTFGPRYVTNSRIDAQSNIIPLPKEYYMVTPLPGSAGGTLFGYPGKTMILYLKEACGNIAWDPPIAPPATTNSNTGQVAPPSPAVFCPPKPCDCESMVGEWKHGPETGPCAWKDRWTGQAPCENCTEITVFAYYVKWDGSSLYLWEKTDITGKVIKGRMHAKPWFVTEKPFWHFHTPNY